MNAQAEPRIDASADDSSQSREQTRRECIEIGIIEAGPLDSTDREALGAAVEQARTYLESRFSTFQFVFSRLRRPELEATARVEPSQLLQQAVRVRDARHWDFAIVLTGADLIGNYSPYCFAALSRPLDAGVISLSLIDPAAEDDVGSQEQRVTTLAYRLSRLILHAVGHLAGLNESPDKSNLLFHPADAAELDEMHELNREQIENQQAWLAEIGDERLEEGEGSRLSQPAFLLHAAWINRREIVAGILAARPWKFPQRLSRLTIASVSTATVLYMTAEAWDLALSQSLWQICWLVLLTLLATTAYVIVRQQLLIRRSRRRSEQTVVTSASALGIVFSGMLMTWLTMVAFGLCLSQLLFHSELIRTWAASTSFDTRGVGFLDKGKMSCFSASLGLLIGSLGASFESQTYFRHVIFVDEEL